MPSGITERETENTVGRKHWIHDSAVKITEGKERRKQKKEGLRGEKTREVVCREGKTQ